MLVMLLIALPAFAQTEANALKPAWDCTFERGIEWCAPVGGDPGTALLICAKDSRIEMIDLQTGRSRLAESVAVQPGTRFAGSTGNVAYGCGLSQAYALRVDSVGSATDPNPGLLWRAAVAPRSQTAGDPEFMTRVIAARATSGGLLVVRSDGRVAELNRDDGRVRWRHELPEIANCTLRVRDSAAVVLWKHGEVLRVAFFDLEADHPQPVVRTIEDTLPIWTDLIGEGLVAVWASRYALVSPSADRLLYRTLVDGARPSAAAIVTYAPGKRPTTIPSEATAGSSALLVLQSSDGLPLACEIITGEPVSLRGTALKGVGLLLLRLSGDLLFQFGGSGFSVWRLPVGDQLALCRQDGWAISAGANGGFAYGLFSGGQVVGDVPIATERVQDIQDDRSRGTVVKQAGRSDGSWPIWLVREVMTGEPGPHPGEQVDALPREYTLGQAGFIRETFWLGGRLVIVEDHRVRAYTLP